MFYENSLRKSKNGTVLILVLIFSVVLMLSLSYLMRHLYDARTLEVQRLENDRAFMVAQGV